MKNRILEYDLFKKNLLKIVKTKGVLVKKMKRSDNFLLDASAQAKLYKTCLGTVEKYDLFHKKIKHVYVVYEGLDNTIKYYDYSQ